MKIDGFQPHRVYASFSKDEQEKKTAKQVSEQAQSTGLDRVEISAEGAGRQEVSRLSAQIASGNDEDARAERLETVKKQVQAGTYSVSARDVAAGILGTRVDRKA